MKGKLFNFYWLTGFAIILSACSNNPQRTDSDSTSIPVTYSAEDSLEAAALGIPVTEMQPMSEETLRKRAAAKILSGYIESENYRYRLTVSEAEAQKLGVTPELYKAIQDDLNVSNNIIREHFEKGDTLEMPDLKALYKAYNDSVAN